MFDGNFPIIIEIGMKTMEKSIDCKGNFMIKEDTLRAKRNPSEL